MNTDVVISTRIRLARNLAGYPFPVIIRDSNLELDIVNQIGSVLSKAGGFTVKRMDKLNEVEKSSLVERYIISKLLANTKNGAVSISYDELLTVMINEEDHIREQCMVNGFDFEGCYQRIASVDKIIGANCRLAVKNGNYYYTACPTNLGTGMRASVMAFLPAITKSGSLQDIREEANSKGITIRGAFGEGSFAEGYYYQISNSVTEDVPSNIIKKVKSFVVSVCAEEKELRALQLSNAPLVVKDKCLRALGVLQHSVLLSYEEFCELISQVKLGIYYGFIGCKDPSLIDVLTVTARKNTLLLNGSQIKGSTEDEKRANYIKNSIKSIGCEEIFN